MRAIGNMLACTMVVMTLYSGLHAQSVSVDTVWTYQEMDGNSHRISTLRLLNDGSSVTVAKHWNVGVNELILLKLAADGTEVWNRKLQAGGTNEPADLAVLTDGSLAVTGQDWILRTDSNGVIQWKRSLCDSCANPYSIRLNCLLAEKNGSVWVAGTKNDSLLFYRFSSDGEAVVRSVNKPALTWILTLEGVSIVRKSNSDILIGANATELQGDFFQQRTMLFTFDSAGSFKTYKSMFNMFNTSGLVSLGLRSDGKSVLLEEIHNGANYNDASLSYLNASLIKYDSIAFGSTASDYPFALSIDDSDHALIAGTSRGFGVRNNQNLWLAKFSPNGTLAWNRTFFPGYEGIIWDAAGSAPGEYLFAATRRISGGLNGIVIAKIREQAPAFAAGQGQNVPHRFTVGQNYPNPFNGSTVIPLFVPAETQVRLTIRDVLGRIIAEPMNDIRSPGEHRIRWNSGSISGGVYFYTMQTSQYSITRKLTIIK